MDAAADEHRLKRIKFRAWRRGFVEADLILGPFVDRHSAAMTTTQLDSLEALLDQGDHDLYDWIIGRAPTPPEFDTDVMEQIRSFRFDAHAGTREAGA